jgi:hypothetical protein
LSFAGEPVETTWNGLPAISVKVHLNGFPIKPCDTCPYCAPPPVSFVVGIAWQNPNDPGGDPNCWIPTFAAYAQYGLFYISRVYRGNGSITLLDPGQPGVDTCCYMLKCSGSTWEIISWPVLSGMYKVELPGCGDCTQWKPCDWGPPSYKLIDKKSKKINNQAADFLAFSDLFYVSSDDQDTLFSGATMEVAKEYDIVCRIHTSKSIEIIPDFLIGYLEPEDLIIPTQKIFIRDPAGDVPLPCNQNYPYRIFGYRCSDSFMPYTMFPHIDPPEWSYLTRYLDCKLYAEENHSRNGIGIRTTIMAGLQLDCTNDSTVCFRPAAWERMEFIFRYGPEMGLTPDHDLRFKISDKDGIWVYEEPISIPYMEPIEDELGIPFTPSADTMILTWDGRQNIGENAGHLADPDLSSYNAVVQWLDQFGNLIIRFLIPCF